MNIIMYAGENSQLASSERLMMSAGNEIIGDACAVYALIAYSSGGAILANPIGGAVAGFCVGYALGSAIAGWL